MSPQSPRLSAVFGCSCSRYINELGSARTSQSLPPNDFGKTNSYWQLTACLPCAKHNHSTMVSFLFRVIDSTSDQIEDGIGYRSSRQRSLKALPRIPYHQESPYIQQHVACFHHKVSPFISTTSSFLWALWEASRRDDLGGDIDNIRIMVIDQDAINPLDIRDLRADPYHDKLCAKLANYARSSSEVLVKHRIPEGAILASITWEGIRSEIRDKGLQLGSLCGRNEHPTRTFGRRLQSWRGRFARDRHGAKSILGQDIRDVCNFGVEGANERKWTTRVYGELVQRVFSELQ